MDTPFNMIISSMMACGKPHYLLNMLEKYYKGHFENIFLICPTYFWNKTYQNCKHNDNKRFFLIPCDQNEVDGLHRYITNIYCGTNSLISLDDCASSQSIKNRTSEIVKLGFSARHIGFSTIVSTQQLTAIANPYRENISKWVTFYNPNRKDMQTVLDESLHVTKEEEKRIIGKLKNNKYARLEILLRHPYTQHIVCPT